MIINKIINMINSTQFPNSKRGCENNAYLQANAIYLIEFASTLLATRQHLPCHTLYHLEIFYQSITVTHINAYKGYNKNEYVPTCDHLG